MNERVRTNPDTSPTSQRRVGETIARDKRSPRVSWFVSVVIGVAAAVALAVLLLYIPHWMLTRLPSLSRSVRVAMATSWIAASTLCLLWLGIRFGRAPVPAE